MFEKYLSTGEETEGEDVFKAQEFAKDILNRMEKGVEIPRVYIEEGLKFSIKLPEKVVNYLREEKERISHSP